MRRWACDSPLSAIARGLAARPYNRHMNNPIDVWPNAWKSLQQMIPGNSHHDEELQERISALEQQVTRLEQESQWRGIELDRRINELGATVERNAEHNRHVREWTLADKITALVLFVVALGVLVPVFLTLFGVINPLGQPIKWVSFGLAAFAMVACVATLILRDRLPRAMNAIVLLVASVVLLICAWLV